MVRKKWGFVAPGAVLCFGYVLLSYGHKDSGRNHLKCTAFVKELASWQHNSHKEKKKTTVIVQTYSCSCYVLARLWSKIRESPATSHCESGWITFSPTQGCFLLGDICWGNDGHSWRGGRQSQKWIEILLHSILVSLVLIDKWQGLPKLGQESA